ncbi:MAG: hypothetical protein JKY46_11790 [Robiginitomaculum sp.]|nr:hypothetical protein [Robiginitomaculum sp.]
MKLQYNILCIDNIISSLVETKSDITEFNDNVGINVEFHDVEVSIGAREEDDDFRLRIMEEIETHFAKTSFELILVDLHMTGGVTGDDVISVIRESHSMYRPIIFYSEGEPSGDDVAVQELTAAALSAGLNGKSIFISGRDNLSALAFGIFKEMHNEEHKVNRVRGLLMDRVSEFDAKIIEISKNEGLWKQIPKENKNKIVTEFKRFLAKDKKDADQIYKRVNRMDIDEIQTLVSSDSRDISTFRKGSLLRALFRYIEKFKTNGDVLSDGINGDDSMIGIRNTFAHTTSEDLGFEQSPETCKHIREMLCHQLKNIDDICEKI